MNKQQALYKFWSGFDIPAYEQYSVPDNAKLPYITYSESVNSIGEVAVMNASVWDFAESWEWVIEKANEIGDTIGRGGYTINYDGGLLWIVRGTPFAQRMGDESDHRIKRVVINIMAEYISQD